MTRDKPPRWSSPSPQSLVYKAGLSRFPYRLKCNFVGDGLGTRKQSLTFMADPAFEAAWTDTVATYWQATGENAPDTRWRAHVAVWAARHGLALEGDFVDCGVFTGTLAQMICRLTDFPSCGKNYWLFDTWSGVPTEGLAGSDLALANRHNALEYHRHDVYATVEKTFSAWPACRLVRGALPQSLAAAAIEKIAYLSVDLNNSVAEKGTIEALWPKLVPNAFVVIDDYGWVEYRAQQVMWDAFAAAQGRMIATLPTGQGLLIK
jgi:hypothetical protein